MGGLAALLTTGRLSDYLGRRWVLFGALVGQIVGMLTFVVASDVTTLIVARLVVGTATGAGLGAIGAWLIDLQPGAGLASLANGVCTLAGLGLGAFLTGILVQYGPDPLHLVFWLLAGGYLIALVLILMIPDDIEPRAGWLATLRPAMAVPPSARSIFAAAVPGLIGTFALTGLYLSLGRTSVRSTAITGDTVITRRVLLIDLVPVVCRTGVDAPGVDRTGLVGHPRVP